MGNEHVTRMKSSEINCGAVEEKKEEEALAGEKVAKIMVGRGAATLLAVVY